MNGLGPQPGRQSSWKAGLEDLGFCQSLSCEDFNELYVKSMVNNYFFQSWTCIDCIKIEILGCLIRCNKRKN